MNKAESTNTTPVTSPSLESARKIVIERGSGYYAGSLDGAGIETFSELPGAGLARIEARHLRVLQPID
jgi:hypothetical protein